MPFWHVFFCFLYYMPSGSFKPQIINRKQPMNHQSQFKFGYVWLLVSNWNGFPLSILFLGFSFNPTSTSTTSELPCATFSGLGKLARCSWRQNNFFWLKNPSSISNKNGNKTVFSCFFHQVFYLECLRCVFLTKGLTRETFRLRHVKQGVWSTSTGGDAVFWYCWGLLHDLNCLGLAKLLHFP